VRFGTVFTLDYASFTGSVSCCCRLLLARLARSFFILDFLHRVDQGQASIYLAFDDFKILLKRALIEHEVIRVVLQEA